VKYHILVTFLPGFRMLSPPCTNLKPLSENFLVTVLLDPPLVTQRFVVTMTNQSLRRYSEIQRCPAKGTHAQRVTQ